MSMRIDLGKSLLGKMYYEEYLTTTEIAKRLNVSSGCVLGNMRRYGIRTRGSREKHWKKQDVFRHQHGIWKCWKCKKVKSADQFSPVERHWMAHDYICRSCSTQRRRDWRRQYPWVARAHELNRRAKKEYVTEEHLRSIWLREHGRCYYCGRRLLKTFGAREMTFDHVRPGVNRASNLVLSCHGCNTRKTDMTLADFHRFVSRIEHYSGAEHEVSLAT